jgi:FixJ family two-component response regulator
MSNAQAYLHIFIYLCDNSIFIIRSRSGNCTNVQIAEELGVSVKTVEYRIRQSLKILRIKLKDYLPLLLSFLS